MLGTVRGDVAASGVATSAVRPWAGGPPLVAPRRLLSLAGRMRGGCRPWAQKSDAPLQRRSYELLERTADVRGMAYPLADRRWPGAPRPRRLRGSLLCRRRGSRRDQHRSGGPGVAAAACLPDPRANPSAPAMSTAWSTPSRARRRASTLTRPRSPRWAFTASRRAAWSSTGWRPIGKAHHDRPAHR